MRGILFTLILLFAFQVNSQFHTGRSKSELGVMLGGSYYIGDLNPYFHFKNTNLAGGLIYRYNINPRVSLRANLTYGKVEAYDSEAKDPTIVDRNLSFTSTIFEAATGVEINYFPFQLGNDKYRGTAYLFGEIGGFRMNPKAVTSDGNEIELANLGTEGQGSTLSDMKQYGLYQICLPFGFGAKFALGSRACFSIEYGIRKTFTDYLDDVGSSSYVDPAQLALENGPTSASMSNRSISGSRFGQRGNSSTKDWYAFAGASLTFRLGQPNKCWK